MIRLFQPVPTARDSLVYRFSEYRQRPFSEEGIQWKILERRDLKRFFRKEFLVRISCNASFAKKHVCILIFNQSEWIAYGWIRTPGTKAPPHLPYWVGRLPVYWLYTARTKEKYQNRGYNKLLKNLRIDYIRALETAKEPEIYCDTVENNIPSRRSTLSSGFVPEGILTRRYFKFLKYVNYLLYRNRWGFIWGEWYKDRQHSPM